MRSKRYICVRDANSLAFDVEVYDECLAVLRELMARNAAGHQLEPAALRAANALGERDEISDLALEFTAAVVRASGTFVHDAGLFRKKIVVAM